MPAICAPLVVKVLRPVVFSVVPGLKETVGVMATAKALLLANRAAAKAVAVESFLSFIIILQGKVSTEKFLGRDQAFCFNISINRSKDIYILIYKELKSFADEQRSAM
ncbi:MAG: hypothetical protein PHD76_15225 [Methylacidiphilales bacterium]|nr:hypothetical protein [Candidatus Methylacidiphilales bacterium]